MTKKILAGTLAAVILLGLAYYSGFLYSQRQYRREEDILLQKLEQLAAQLSMQEAQGSALDGGEKQEASVDPKEVKAEYEQESYYLVLEKGSVNIYLSDKTTLYEHTSIMAEDLPEKLRLEVLEGKCVQGEQELYDFLENYSS